MAAQDQKALSLKLTEIQAVFVDAIAKAEGKTRSDVIREAIYAHIEKRKADPEFQKRLRAQIEENAAVLKRLAR